MEEGLRCHEASEGFISAQLYDSAADATVMINVAVWGSAGDLYNAFASADFQALLAEYPDGTVAYPTLLRKVAVEKICVAQ